MNNDFSGEFDFEHFDVDSMSNEEILAFAFRAYEEEMAARRDEDYEINHPQMDKFAELFRFLMRISKENHIKFEPIKYSPKEEHGDLVIHFNLMYLTDKDVPEFAKVISYTSAFDISADLDGVVCMSMKVPNVFIKKE